MHGAGQGARDQATFSRLLQYPFRPFQLVVIDDHERRPQNDFRKPQLSFRFSELSFDVQLKTHEFHLDAAAIA